MNDRELEIIGHSLGINVYGAKKSKLKKDKKLPKDFYRNHFQASEGHTDWEVLLSLVEKEFMTQSTAFGMPYFYVTEKGKMIFRDRLKTVVK